MNDNPRPDDSTEDFKTEDSDFATQAESAPSGLLAEFWDFLVNNKKWWLTPIILVLLIMGGLILLTTTAAAPFIYTLF